MRRFWLVFTFAPAVLPSDHWIGGDKVQHFFTSAFVQSMAYGSLRAAGTSHGLALGGATAATAAVGIGKEFRDLRVKGEFSLRDLSWDAAGAGAATVLLVRTRR